MVMLLMISVKGFPRVLLIRWLDGRISEWSNQNEKKFKIVCYAGKMRQLDG